MKLLQTLVCFSAIILPFNAAADTKFSIGLGTSDWHVQETALGETLVAFLGAPAGGGGGGGAGGIANDVRSDLSGVNVRVRIPGAFSFSIADESPLNDQWSWGWQAMALRSKASYFLPTGIPATANSPALPDPTTLTFRATSLRAQIGLSRSFNPFWGTITPSLGTFVGVDKTWVTTSVQSALLDVTNDSRVTSRFAQVRASFAYPISSGGIVNDWTVTRFEGETTTLAIQLRYQF